MPLQISITPRILHFKEPAHTSRGVYHEHPIWLLHVSDPQRPGYRGTGECAPLPDLSADYSPDYEERLCRVCKRVEQSGCLDTEALRPLPSMLFGLETALRRAEAAAEGRQAIYDTPFARAAVGVPTNGLVWMGTSSEMRQRLHDKLAAGYRCIKIKIGAIDFDDELALIKAARRDNKNAYLSVRVDANGAFSPDSVMEYLRRLAPYDLHSIEQPIRAGQRETLAQLCRESPIPIALDEELIGIFRADDKARLLDEVRPAYIVLKPTLHGGLCGCEEWIRLAEERGVGWWVTSALESNVGLSAIAHWTAHLLHQRGLFQHAMRHRILPQGLGTGALFTDNIPVPALQMRGDELWWCDNA